jgi:carbamoyltransferase
MNHIGISCGFHDAAISLIDSSGQILFAAHSERYSMIKHDRDLNTAMVQRALSLNNGAPYTVNYYERPWLKYLRQIRSGQYSSPKNLSLRHLIGHDNYRLLANNATQFRTHDHHLSHAAAGFQTSGHDRATVVVIDAIGEWDTITIWAADYDSHGRYQYRQLWRQTYPDSIGLFYSAMTQRVGLRPLDEEYILMGMAGWGDPHRASYLLDRAVADVDRIEFKQNFHVGTSPDFMSTVSDYDIAAATQVVTERLITSVMARARDFGWSQNLVYAGGVALNCTANRLLGNYFDNIWIMPCPGDAGSSLGAAALAHGGRIIWHNAYLGDTIPGHYPVDAAIGHLLDRGICGVASGQAEFGPRALGNRSLLADPRGPDIKDRVNDIKRRQRFRPFAPVILEEHVNDYFDMPVNWSDSRYMQTVAHCKYPEKYPAIIHVDGTSRVQTVPRDGSGIRQLLEAWYRRTGCPMLLNTSLNIRGEPVVNDRSDADRFEHLYSVPVVS